MSRRKSIHLHLKAPKQDNNEIKNKVVPGTADINGNNEIKNKVVSGTVQNQQSIDRVGSNNVEGFSIE